MAAVRAKFKVQKYETALMTTNPKGETQEVRTIVLTPVYSQDKKSENGKFWEYTPSGEIRLGTVNPHAWQAFELGKEYYVDFTPADEQEERDEQ